MAILLAGINTDPSQFVPTLDNIEDLGNDSLGFNDIYGSNAGQSVVYGNIAYQGILNTARLATPSAPTLATVGAAGATTYGYRVVATVLGGDATSLYTAASSETQIATGNATLDANNYIQLTWASVPGATGYRIYRTTGGATQGLIATITNGNTLTVNDTGLAGGGETSPTTNVTGEFNLAGLGSFRITSNGTDVALDKITTGGILNLWNRADAEGLLLDFTKNVLEFSATGWGIRAAAADASTLLLQAQNAAGGTQTVLTVVGAATVANSYITAQVGGTWTLASGQTWTLPALTFGGATNVNGQTLTGIAEVYSQTSAAILLVSRYQNAGSNLSFYTTGAAAGYADTLRLALTGAAATAVATWTAITHTGIVITSGQKVEGAGTGANGFVLKNLKNAAASALSGTQLDVEIDIGGVPYYFTVYPTKA